MNEFKIKQILNNIDKMLTKAESLTDLIDSNLSSYVAKAA